MLDDHVEEKCIPIKYNFLHDKLGSGVGSKWPIPHSTSKSGHPDRMTELIALCVMSAVCCYLIIIIVISQSGWLLAWLSLVSPSFNQSCKAACKQALNEIKTSSSSSYYISFERCWSAQLSSVDRHGFFQGGHSTSISRRALIKIVFTYLQSNLRKVTMHVPTSTVCVLTEPETCSAVS